MPPYGVILTIGRRPTIKASAGPEGDRLTTDVNSVGTVKATA